MKIYLAGGESYYRDVIGNVISKLQDEGFTVNTLWSYYSYIQRGKGFYCNADNQMIDSGAFTFIQSGKLLDWDKYINGYIDFLKEYNPDYFFELDVDKIIGYDRVKEIRRRLERETGKRPIPVWHKHLGKDEFIRMCDEYDYVAIGGIVSKEIMPTEYKYFPAFIREAHKRGTKIHGLGFSNNKWLPICHFDSIDSTSWTYGTRAGQIYHFIPKKGCQFTKCPKGRRTRPVVAIHNFVEWVKFSNWAETHL